MDLNNRAVWINHHNQRIRIGGVGDLWRDSQDIQPTLAKASNNDFVILVSHNPDYVEELPNQTIDLVLSGHTHGGQVTLFGLWAPSIPSDYCQKYQYGFIRTHATSK